MKTLNVEGGKPYSVGWNGDETPRKFHWRGKAVKKIIFITLQKFWNFSSLIKRLESLKKIKHKRKEDKTQHGDIVIFPRNLFFCTHVVLIYRLQQEQKKKKKSKKGRRKWQKNAPYVSII